MKLLLHEIEANKQKINKLLIGFILNVFKSLLGLERLDADEKLNWKSDTNDKK